MYALLKVKNVVSVKEVALCIYRLLHCESKKGVIIWPHRYLLIFWHAPLGVHSAIRRHQPPQRTVLGQADCFVQCEVVDSQIALDGVQPRNTRTPC